jgi:predicted lipoprotein with Yx(FWY)xxD motif
MQVLAEDDRKPGPSGSASAGAPVAQPTAKRGTTIKVEKTEYGKALVNGAGKAVYLFDIEEGPTAECYDDCATAWPPVLTKGKPVAGDGAKQGKLGTTTRKDGSRQVTYAGHPLYFYVHDTPDEILCQDVVEFGGRWLLVRPNGTALR